MRAHAALKSLWERTTRSLLEMRQTSGENLTHPMGSTVLNPSLSCDPTSEHGKNLLVVAGFPACLPGLNGRLESLLPPEFGFCVGVMHGCQEISGDAQALARYD